MPIICEFLGMKIYMYYQDHSPPHIHVRGAYNAAVDFSGNVIAGHLPPNVASRLTVWVQMHTVELQENWKRAQAGETLFRIPPLR